MTEPVADEGASVAVKMTAVPEKAVGDETESEVVVASAVPVMVSALDVLPA